MSTIKQLEAKLAELEAKLAAAPAPKDEGALWLPKDPAASKCDLCGHITVAGRRIALWAYATGSDGTELGKNGGRKPVFNLSAKVEDSLQ